MNIKLNTQLALVFGLVLSASSLPAMEQPRSAQITTQTAISAALAIVFGFLSSVRCPLSWDDEFHYTLDTIAFVSDSDHRLYVNVRDLEYLLQLAPGLASIIESYDGLDASWIRVHSVHWWTLYILQDLLKGDRDTVSSRLRELTDSQLRRLACDAEYLGATKILDLIQRRRSA